MDLDIYIRSRVKRVIDSEIEFLKSERVRECNGITYSENCIRALNIIQQKLDSEFGDDSYLVAHIDLNKDG